MMWGLLLVVCIVIFGVRVSWWWKFFVVLVSVRLMFWLWFCVVLVCLFGVWLRVCGVLLCVFGVVSGWFLF